MEVLAKVKIKVNARAISEKVLLKAEGELTPALLSYTSKNPSHLSLSIATRYPDVLSTRQEGKEHDNVFPPVLILKFSFPFGVFETQVCVLSNPFWSV